MHNALIYALILTSFKTFCADPYATMRIELGQTMRPEEVEKLIKEDETARKSTFVRVEPPTPLSVLQRFPPKPMTPDEQAAYRARMVQRVKDAQAAKLKK